MKKLFGTTALVMALAMPAFAQDATAPAPDATTNQTTTEQNTTNETMATDPNAAVVDTNDPNAIGNQNTTAGMDNTAAMQSPYLEGIDRGVRASDFIGKRVYVTEQDTSTLSLDAIATANTEWDDAGEISDLIISLNGDAEAVLVDFGGFLGIGEKTVAISMANLVMVPDSNSPDDYFIVFHGNKDQLQGAPLFNPDMVFVANDANTGAMNNAGDVNNTAGMNNATTGANQNQVAPADSTRVGDANTAAGTMEGQMVDLSTMSEADLIGARVYGPNNEDIGEISAVSMDNNAINAAIVDVGGFLGMGEKRVALDSSALQMVPDADGRTSFRVSMTQEQLEALPAYDR
jgi:hypothetical protein